MDALTEIGWGPRWEALLGEHGPGAEPGRVLRHDGVAVQVRTPSGDRSVKLRRGLPPVTVGDWLALVGEQVLALLPRGSLLRRRAAGGEEHQLLAANVDLVLLVMGLDRAVKAGRIRRGEALAFDAGAHPVLVLTKADLTEDLGATLAQINEEHPGLEVVVTSAATGEGIDKLRARMAGATSVLLGESGAGKSRLVNALSDAEVAVVGRVREGDHKGRHTTTNRQLHVLPTGGIVVDSPGIREVGLAGDEESVDATFADIDELGEECHFSNCQHAGEPGCAVALAIESGELTADRLEAYRELRAEVVAAARRADPHQRRTFERTFTKAVESYVRSEHHKKK
ncbi:MAG TPA: ribosome small subunit-dependent GTPase A [Acidimicrobiales bacterium]|nr:ribosome small subunit-dependent GTPase A [Acidimicrobiales bacterium]